MSFLVIKSAPKIQTIVIIEIRKRYEKREKKYGKLRMSMSEEVVWYLWKMPQTYHSQFIFVVGIMTMLLIFYCFINQLFRFVGPYLKICPEHVFVVEDGDGICGYAVAAPDSKHFYEQFKKHWLPEV